MNYMKKTLGEMGKPSPLMYHDERDFNVLYYDNQDKLKSNYARTIFLDWLLRNIKINQKNLNDQYREFLFKNISNFMISQSGSEQVFGSLFGWDRRSDYPDETSDCENIDSSNFSEDEVLQSHNHYEQILAVARTERDRILESLRQDAIDRDYQSILNGTNKYSPRAQLTNQQYGVYWVERQFKVAKNVFQPFFHWFMIITPDLILFIGVISFVWFALTFRYETNISSMIPFGMRVMRIGFTVQSALAFIFSILFLYMKHFYCVWYYDECYVMEDVQPYNIYLDNGQKLELIEAQGCSEQQLQNSYRNEMLLEWNLSEQVVSLHDKQYRSRATSKTRFEALMSMGPLSKLFNSPEPSDQACYIDSDDEMLVSENLNRGRRRRTELIQREKLSQYANKRLKEAEERKASTSRSPKVSPKTSPKINRKETRLVEIKGVKPFEETSTYYSNEIDFSKPQGQIEFQGVIEGMMSPFFSKLDQMKGEISIDMKEFRDHSNKLMEEAKSTLKEADESVNSVLTRLFCFTSFMTFAIMANRSYVRNQNVRWKVFTIISAVSMLGTSSTVRDLLLNTVKDLLNLPKDCEVPDNISEADTETLMDELEPQSIDVSVFRTVGYFLTAYLGFEIFKGKPMSKSSIASTLSKVQATTGFRGSNTDLISEVLNMAIKIVNVFKSSLLGGLPITLMSGTHKPFDSWMQNVLAISSLEFQGEFKANQINLRKLNQLYMMGLEFSCSKDLSLKDRMIQDALQTCMRQLTRILNKFSQVHLDVDGPRMMPLAFFFLGGTAVGKSYLLQPFFIQLLTRLRKEKLLDFCDLGMKSQIYTRAIGGEYWEGYNGQPVCVFNEALQIKEQFLERSEAAEIMNCNDTWAFNLNMAALESKGLTFFNSPITACTSNFQKHYDASHSPQDIIESIRCSAAFWRRFTYIVEVNIKDEYAMTDQSTGKKTIDKSKLVGGPIFNTDIYEFHIYNSDMVNRGEEKMIVSYQQLLDMSVEQFRRRFNDYTQHNEYMATLWDDPDSDEFDFNRESSKTMDVSSEFRENVEHSYDLLVAQGLIEVSRVDRSNITTYINCDDDDKSLFQKYYAILAQKKNDLLVYASWLSAGILQQIEDRTSFISKFHDNYLPIKLKWQTMKCRIETSIRKYPKLTFLLNIFNSDLFQFSMSLLALGLGAYATKHLWSLLKGFFSSAKDKAKRLISSVTKDNPYQQQEIYIADESQKNVPIFKNFLTQSWFEKGATYASPMELQSGDKNSDDMLRKAITNNSFCIMSPYSGIKVGTLLFLEGDIAILNRHYITWFDQELSGQLALPLDTQVEFEAPFRKEGTNKFSISLSYLRDENNYFVFSEDMDLVAIKMPIQWLMPSIEKFFIDESKFDNQNQFQAVLAVLNGAKGIDKYYTKAKIYGNLKSSYNKYTGKYLHSKAIAYVANTVQGTCGSLLASSNKHISGGRICGVHMGMDESYAYAVPIYKETVQFILAHYNKLKGIKTEEVDDIDLSKISSNVLTVQYNEFPLTGNFEVVKQDLNEQVTLACKSKIKRSVLHGLWGPSVMSVPNPLANKTLPDGSQINIMRYQLNQYGETLPPGDMPSIEEAVRMVGHHINNNSDKPKKWQILALPIREAVLGFADNPYAKPIPRNTSAGYPWYKMSNSKGKTEWFGEDVLYDLSSKKMQEMIKVVNEEIAKILREEHVEFWFIDCPKDEKLLVQKILEGKLRLFSISPLDLTIIWRIYFLGFQVWLTENKIRNSIGVGMNVYSAEWDTMYRILKSYGMENGFNGDFSKFDKRQLATIIDAIWKWYVGPWYEINWAHHHKENDVGYAQARKEFEDAQKVRAYLWYKMSHSEHIFLSWFYKWVQSLPSGHPFTIFLNCLINLVYLCYAWIRSRPPSFKSTSLFEKVGVVVYGDDNIGSVDDQVKTWYNPTTMQKHLLELGQQFTSTRKDSSIMAFENVQNLTFLKRAFRYDDHVCRYVAPLNITSILEMPYWTKRCSFAERITQDNVDTALMELSLHGRKMWNQHARKILTASSEYLGYYPKHYHWESARNFACNFEPYH